MSIPKAHQFRMVYHFTHVENLPAILQQGGLLSTNEKSRRALQHYDIAYEGIQLRRSNTGVPCGPQGTVHDYVPFYFSKRNEMLKATVYGRVADQQLIVFLRYKLSRLLTFPFVFTDASANTADPPNFYADAAQLDQLDWEIIDSQKWSAPDDDARHRRMAEFLVHGTVPLDAVDSIVVWNNGVKDHVQECLDRSGKNIPIVFDPYHFFTAFYDPKRKLLPPVTGPYFIGISLANAKKQVSQKSEACTYASLSNALASLREDLNNIPLTAALVGLQSDGFHGDISVHTQQVVRHLKGLERYKALTSRQRKLTKLAAYLHDVGKGIPNDANRENGKYKRDIDHPIQALPACAQLLNNIADVTEEEAGIVLTLVCYHDLIGDLCANRRRIHELAPIAKNEELLQMLTALSEADILAVHEMWHDSSKIEDILQRARDHDGGQ